MSEEAEVTISYLILCHDSPDRIVRLVTRILSDDETGQVVIHFDKNTSRAKFNELKARLNNTPRCHVLEKRIKCGWGQWSLVQATLNSLKFAFYNYGTDYYYLLSEFCYPIKPLWRLKYFLIKSNGGSFLECEDKSWIKGGISTDRYSYFHFLNKRKYPKSHRFLYRLQKKLCLIRKPPKELKFSFGSQWWCLHVSTIPIFIKTYERYRYFFRFVWIPDELFFSTIAKSFGVRTISTCLTRYEFDDSGKPNVINFTDLRLCDSTTNDNFFFIRKVL